jgi:dCTP deaminase
MPPKVYPRLRIEREMSSEGPRSGYESTRAWEDDGRFGYLTKESIIERIQREKPECQLVRWSKHIEETIPNLEQRVNSWFCDLRLGEQAFLSSDKHASNLEWEHDFTINPGEFALLMTDEEVNIPDDLAAFISLRFKVALRGLINISGRHVDPGYQGKLVFSVYNAGSNPVILKRGDPIFMIVFARLDGRAKPRNDPHFSRITNLSSEWMSWTKGPPVSLLQVNRRLEKLEIRFDVFVGIVSAAAVITAGALLAWAAGIKP